MDTPNSTKDKCSVSGRLVTPCKDLSESTEFGNPHGKQKGIWCWEFFKTDTAGPVRRFWGSKSGDHVAKGMAFNYCPFCGEKIDAPFAQEVGGE
jgi:hypothetical protein